MSGSSALNTLIVRQVKHGIYGTRPLLLVFCFHLFIHFSFHFYLFLSFTFSCGSFWAPGHTVIAMLLQKWPRPHPQSDLLQVMPSCRPGLQVLRGDALQEMPQPMHFGQPPQHEHFITNLSMIKRDKKTPSASMSYTSCSDRGVS